ncbi:MAG: uncharacterized protein A8A55_1421 [Amphiamblys sp. WSBS2006]|nr:MAG: uncharacterized protein A8A55_1421 [Amphiamblys sp. WSBS2006]
MKHALMEDADFDFETPDELKSEGEDADRETAVLRREIRRIEKEKESMAMLYKTQLEKLRLELAGERKVNIKRAKLAKEEERVLAIRGRAQENINVMAGPGGKRKTNESTFFGLLSRMTPEEKTFLMGRMEEKRENVFCRLSENIDPEKKNEVFLFLRVAQKTIQTVKEGCTEMIVPIVGIMEKNGGKEDGEVLVRCMDLLCRINRVAVCSKMVFFVGNRKMLGGMLKRFGEHSGCFEYLFQVLKLSLRNVAVKKSFFEDSGCWETVCREFRWSREDAITEGVLRYFSCFIDFVVFLRDVLGEGRVVTDRVVSKVALLCVGLVRRSVAVDCFLVSNLRMFSGGISCPSAERWDELLLGSVGELEKRAKEK